MSSNLPLLIPRHAKVDPAKVFQLPLRHRGARKKDKDPFDPYERIIGWARRLKDNSLAVRFWEVCGTKIKTRGGQKTNETRVVFYAQAPPNVGIVRDEGGKVATVSKSTVKGGKGGT